MIDVILAAPGIAQEADLVSGAPRAGFRVLRRCVDAADLLAACAADAEAVAVVSCALPRLSRDIVERVGGVVIGLAGGPADVAALHGLGIDGVVELESSMDARQAWGVLAGRLRRARALGTEPIGSRADGVWRLPEADDPRPDVAPDRGSPGGAGATAGQRAGLPKGRVIAVWGPVGAPGRTTIALGLAEALADAGLGVCAVDADTYGPSMALAIDRPEAVGGVLRSCRQAEAGSLSADALVGLATPVDRGLRVLGGLPVVDRWPELRGSALDRLWEACRRAFDVTVVDVGFCLERDEGAGPFSTVRNAAALSVLGQAESVVAVADGSALGAARLVGAWPALERAAAGAVTVVGNRRSSRDWDAAVRALGVAAPVHRVPEDARALAACWARGRTLRQGARRSGLRRSLAGLADAVVRR